MGAIHNAGTGHAGEIHSSKIPAGKVVHLKRWTSFFETFPVGLNRSIEFWTKISENFSLMYRARYFRPGKIGSLYYTELLFYS